MATSKNHMQRRKKLLIISLLQTDYNKVGIALFASSRTAALCPHSLWFIDLMIIACAYLSEVVS